MLPRDFWSFVEIRDYDFCWLWVGTKSGKYGVFCALGKHTLAHVYAYNLAYGSVPARKEVHHICVNKLCVNQKHLVAVTRMYHQDSGAQRNRNKTHCPYGHEYTKENTHYHTSNGKNRRTTTRKCKTCDRINHKRKN